MNHLSTRMVVVLLAILLIASGSSALADEHEDAPGALAESWVMTVDIASQPAFEEAFKAHMAVRGAHEDPYDWQVYVNETGDSMNTYVVRACCNDWASKDAYEAWGEANPDVAADWAANVHPHVSNYGHHYTMVDFANSNWPEDTEANFVSVTTYHVKHGAGGEFDAVRAELSQIALNEGWAEAGHTWAWTTSVDGKPAVVLAVPHENYADMAMPSPNFFEFLSGHLGSADAAAEMFGRFNDATTGSEYTIYEHRSDLTAAD